MGTGMAHSDSIGPVGPEDYGKASQNRFARTVFFTFFLVDFCSGTTMGAYIHWIRIEVGTPILWYPYCMPVVFSL